jgi:hypothetical protein
VALATQAFPEDSLVAKQPGYEEPSLSLIERFLRREEPPLRTYRAHRRLEARNVRFKATGWMEVVTELNADRQLTWKVIEEGGSGYIRNKVLRRVLEGEAAAVRAGDPAKAALTDANYNFFASELLDDETARIRIEPRRKDVLLVSGAILLTRGDGDLVQIEGRLSKSPSFGTRMVDVVRRYGRKNGIRVPLSVESISAVRIAGRSEFVMTYAYESINGKPISDR